MTIKDLAGRNILTRGKHDYKNNLTRSGTKTPVSYVSVGVDENQFTTKNVKDVNPRWTSLDFVRFADSTLSTNVLVIVIVAQN